MHRRQFLQYGAASAATALIPAPVWAQIRRSVREYHLEIEPVDAEMIDGNKVYMVVFMRVRGPNEGSEVAEVPRPVLSAVEGDTVKITITNNDRDNPHAFEIPGVTQVIGPIAPQQTVSFSFTAPVGGSYLYIDPLNAPINRLLGLHGAFVVQPARGYTLRGSPIPYSPVSQTNEARAVFDALGTHKRYPGGKWHPTDSARQKVWLFHQVDPELHYAADPDNGLTVNAAAAVRAFLPKYFTINGMSGFDNHDNYDLMPRGYVGEPCLIRTMNAGLCTHAPHIHGNHVFVVARSGERQPVKVLNNIYECDTWQLPPLGRVDVLLPFEKPADVPAAAWPPRQEPFPMRYVMHCHTEMSQTAGGGNYPQGAVMHWELLGPLRT